MTKIYVSCQKVHCACYTSVYQTVFTSYCSPFAHNISLAKTHSQDTYRSWWNIDAFCPTFSSLPFSSSFWLHWLSSTAFQAASLTSMYAESILEHLVQCSHPAVLGIPDPWCSCLALYQIQHPLRNRLRCHLDHRSPHSGSANLQCLKCFEVSYPHHFRLDDSWFFGFGGHLIIEFGLQGGPLQRKVAAKKICLAM